MNFFPTPLRERQISYERGAATYKLFSKENKTKTNETAITYSIMVETLCGDEKESEIVDEVASDFEKANKIFEIFANELVLPGTAKDVLEYLDNLE